MQPIILKGRQAFSDFRLAALKKALNEAIDAHNIAEIDAVECYFIEAANPARRYHHRARFRSPRGTGTFQP